MRNRFIILLTIGLLVLMTGCSSTPSSNAPEQNNPAAVQGDNSQNNSSNEQKGPEEKADLIGKITAISENTLKVAELKLPDDSQGGLPAGDKNGGQAQPDEAKQGQPEEQPDGQSGAGRAPREMTYEETGNTYTLLIPDDTPLIQRQMGTDGAKETNIAVSDLKEGDILKIWVEKLNADGESTVISAELVPQQEAQSK